jgi:hypothetical protein
MDMNYLVIAYKPDSDDYCRNCLMASYPSDFEIRNFVYDPEYDDANSDDYRRRCALESYAEFLSRNEFMQCNEVGYEVFIYADGIDVTHEFTNEAELLSKELIEKEKQRLQYEKQVKEERERARKEEYERKELERLQQKFKS